MPTAASPVLLTDVEAGLVVQSSAYRLEIPHTDAAFARSPYALLGDATGNRWSKLALIASADTVPCPDETHGIEPLMVEQSAAGVAITVSQRTAAWERKTLTLLCTADAVELSVTVAGTGALTDVTVAGGRAVLEGGAAGVFRSGIGFTSVFVPAPTEPVQFVRPAHSAASLGVVGDADPGRLNGIFSPPPFAFGLGRSAATGAAELPDGDWLGASLRGAIRDLGFTSFRYEPLDGGFLFRLTYEGHTAVSGTWTSPTLVLRPAGSAIAVLDDYREDLVSRGLAPTADAGRPAWWSEPIFCGWGAQCARLALQAAEDCAPVTDLATSLARQDVYDEFLELLAASELHPGTIVIDDRWQAEYGTGTADLAHWPDLKGWIADRHAEGTKVLLWWKAWDPQGLPIDECIVDSAGRPVSVDPANPAYLDHLARIIGGLIGPDGVDADGFKIDFTQRAPSGQTLRGIPGVWGASALHALLETIHRAAKAAKPDALLVTHAIHPAFGDVSDMVRLNDVLERDVAGRPVPVVDQLRMRAAIAAHALPFHLIDTDQWPMPDRAQWLDYADAQAALGVPALYYLEFIDNSGERIGPDDLARVARSWQSYREAQARADR